jgi:hypothetical protein
VTPIRLKGLDFCKIKQVMPHPNFNFEEESSIVIYMDIKGNVNAAEVELIDEEYNE